VLPSTLTVCSLEALYRNWYKDSAVYIILHYNEVATSLERLNSLCKPGIFANPVSCIYMKKTVQQHLASTGRKQFNNISNNHFAWQPSTVISRRLSCP
jgi:hypothetical protein